MIRILYIIISMLSISIWSCISKNESLLNESAALHHLGDLPENPLLLHALTSSLQPTDSMMTVLYGNSLAYDYAKNTGAGNYPTGAVLYHVIWQMAPDEEWFGANVPQNLQSIERIEFLSEGNTTYRSFDNKGLEKSTPDQHQQKRTIYLKGMRMAASP